MVSASDAEEKVISQENAQRLWAKESIKDQRDSMEEVWHTGYHGKGEWQGGYPGKGLALQDVKGKGKGKAFQGACFKCGKGGHKSAECRQVAAIEETEE